MKVTEYIKSAVFILFCLRGPVYESEEGEKDVFCTNVEEGGRVPNLHGVREPYYQTPAG
jgi:hypothetical protein